MQTIQAICNYIDAMALEIFLLWVAVALLFVVTAIVAGLLFFLLIIKKNIEGRER